MCSSLLLGTSLSTLSVPPLFSAASDNDSRSSNDNNVSDDLEMECRLEAALNYARDMDRRYGLCTPASIRAWQVVDDLYLLSSASQTVEHNVKKVFGHEKSIWSLYERS